MDSLDYAVKIDFNIELKSKGLNRLIHNLFNKLPNKPIQRTYQQQLRDCLRIVLINLINANAFLSYSRDDHAKEYKSDKYSAKNIRKVVDFLASAKLVENKPGYFLSQNPESSRMSRIRCRYGLKKLFKKYEVNQNDILINTKKDLIVLRDESKQPISYPETSFTKSAKQNLKKINELSAHHPIVDGNGRYIHRKAQHRVFNGDFKHGGRFYGGGWQSLSGNERLNLKIDHAPVVELDFDEYHPTMLYALNGMTLEEDLYALKGYSPEIRKFLKVVTLVLFNTGDKTMAKKAIQKMVNFRKLRKPNEVTSLDDLIL